MAEEIRHSTASGYLEPISNHSGDTVTRSPRAQQKLPPGNPQPPLPQASGVYNTLNSGDYQHNYTGLSGNLQYDDLYRVQTGSVQYERVPGYVYTMPGQQASNGLSGLDNSEENKVLSNLIVCCSITSLILNCPIGLFSVCYSYMAKTERFYPMRRFYKFMSLVVSTVAIIGFVITMAVTISIISSLNRTGWVSFNSVVLILSHVNQLRYDAVHLQ